MNVKIGADPELFIWDNKENRYVCAFNIIPGSKNNPHVVDKGAVQPDGFAAEFNIDAAENADDFVNNIEAVKKQLSGYLGDGQKLVATPTAVFGFDYIAAQDPKARELGCDPDYNAYTGTTNPRPNGDVVDFRTGAGHIHIGWTDGVDPLSPDHFLDCCTIVRELDARLGIMSLLWDSDRKRRTLYGRAGCFRPKSYGVEYRTMSNKWVDDPMLQRFIFDVAQRTVQDCVMGVNLLSCGGSYMGLDIAHIINTSKHDYATHMARNAWIGELIPTKYRS